MDEQTVDLKQYEFEYNPRHYNIFLLPNSYGMNGVYRMINEVETFKLIVMESRKTNRWWHLK